MSFATFSHHGTERASSRILHAIQEFVTAWAETSAAYVAYRELARKSPSDLAERGLHRDELARRAMELPRLPRR
ncbi:hypothetical protein [Azospirillum sp. ST 5-10]|uniref:hypothetical protein n=1 Tax=unclassified Azospirillum TaxID=2630922 RepID=UPI003F4A2ADD